MHGGLPHYLFVSATALGSLSVAHHHSNAARLSEDRNRNDGRVLLDSKSNPPVGIAQSCNFALLNLVEQPRPLLSLAIHSTNRGYLLVATTRELPPFRDIVRSRRPVLPALRGVLLLATACGQPCEDTGSIWCRPLSRHGSSKRTRQMMLCRAAQSFDQRILQCSSMSSTENRIRATSIFRRLGRAHL